MLFYTGDSEEGSGNWCFKDGVITFQDIFDIYMECFKGKRLSITSDCSYSGSWVKECAKVYDSQGIPACGHYSREKGILLKIRCSCKLFQQATVKAFVQEAIKVVVDEVIYVTGTILSSGQETTGENFHHIICDSEPDEQCQYSAGLPHTWENKTMLRERVCCVISKIGGISTWYYVLVDLENLQSFHDAFKNTRTGVVMGVVDGAKYGKLLYSGQGNKPPQDVMDRIKEQFNFW